MKYKYTLRKSYQEAESNLQLEKDLKKKKVTAFILHFQFHHFLNT